MSAYAKSALCPFRTLALISATLLLTGCYDYRPLSVNGNDVGTASEKPSPQQSEAEEKAALAVKNCTDQFPETTGSKAARVRCIVTATDAIWDKSLPEGSEARHALGSYAIQLAEREDRGEITREQAENLYMQFLQQTPGMAVPPKTGP